MLRAVLLAGLLVALVAAEKASFENYKVFRILPATEEQLELLRQLEDSNEAYSFWSGPSRALRPVDLMVGPAQAAEFARLMDEAGLRYEPFVEDVQRLIESEQPASREAGFGWTRYHSLEEIYAWLDGLAERHPGKVEPLVGGSTYEGRQIRGVRLSFAEGRPGVFVEGGIHAREWISPATVTYLANELLTSEAPEVRRLAEAYDWYLFPSFNPDGYVYTHKSNRLWRKTVSRSGLLCRGADANRNWGYKWMSGGASSNPCAETYAGRSAFSEVETRTMSEYLRALAEQGKIFAYVSFHSYSQLLLFPYGHTAQHLDKYEESYAIGLKTVGALAKRYGTRYVHGNVAETIYVATGGSMDWVKAELKLPVVFTYELRDTGKHGFLLPAEQIVPNGQEVLDSLLAMFEEASRLGYPQPQPLPLDPLASARVLQ